MGENIPTENMPQSSNTSSNASSSNSGTDPIQGFMSDIFGGKLTNAALAAI